MSTITKLADYASQNTWKNDNDTSSVTLPEYVDNLYLMKVGLFLTGVATDNASRYAVWDAESLSGTQKRGLYILDATSKELPGMQEPEKWSYSTDSSLNVTGKQIISRIPGLTDFSIQTPLSLPILYGAFLYHAAYLDTFTVVFEYNDPARTYIDQLIVPECKISITAEGGENAGYAKATIKCSPLGGPIANLPTYYKLSRSAS